MGDIYGRVTVAAVQAAPVVLDREATLAKLESLVQAAADRGARVIVLPEAFVPAYPSSPVFGAVFGGFSDPAAGPAFRRLVANAVEVPSPATEAMSRAARKGRAWLCVGVNERTRTGTLHCTLLLFSPAGELAQVRRKLVPTHDERMVWGPGEAVAPRAVPTEFGALGQLVCWENYMPLARHSLYESGERIHLAPTADASDGWQATLRHIALEGRVFVVGCCQYVTRSMYPADFEVANHYVSTHPQSRFVQTMTAQRTGPQERRTLVNRELAIERASGSERRMLADDDELLATLAESFGLHFPPGTRFRVPALS